MKNTILVRESGVMFSANEQVKIKTLCVGQQPFPFSLSQTEHL